MIAVDTNLLVYAHREDYAFHVKAEGILTGLCEGRSDWAIPWPCVHEFIAIVTHPGICRPPAPLADALLQVECWLESPRIHLLGEEVPDLYWPRLKKVLMSDRDFSRFPELQTVNPLA